MNRSPTASSRRQPSWLRAGVLLVGVLVTTAAAAQSRGELLYTTHCIACHTTKMHWRDQRQATDWPSLIVQVQRWQANAALGWNDDDVAAVAHHLNDTIYRFAPADPRAAWASGTEPAAIANSTSSLQSGSLTRTRKR